MAVIEMDDRATVSRDRPRPRLLLAQRMKPQRDRAVVCALLRALGVAFTEAEVIAPVEAPIDARFRQAQFHLRELGDHALGVRGRRMRCACLRRVRLRTEETSAIQPWGSTSRSVSHTSPPRSLSTPHGMAPGVSDWMSCALSMGTMTCLPRPRKLRRSVRWPCKAGDRCQCCVRPTGWCCMRPVVRLTFFAW